MANNVRVFEVPMMVTNPGDELDSILSENEEQADFTLSKGFQLLSERLQAAAEFYLLLSQKLEDNTVPVDVYCDTQNIELEGDSDVLDDLAAAGYIMDVTDEENDSSYDRELEDRVLYADNVDGYDHWEAPEEDEYPFDFEHREAE